MDSRAKEKKKILAADPRRQKQKKYTTKTRKHEKKAFQPQTVNAVAVPVVSWIMRRGAWGWRQGKKAVGRSGCARGVT